MHWGHLGDLTSGVATQVFDTGPLVYMWKMDVDVTDILVLPTILGLLEFSFTFPNGVW